MDKDRYCSNCGDPIEENNKSYYEDSEFCRDCETAEIEGMEYGGI